MKRSELEKHKGKKIVGRMHQEPIPDRYGQAASAPLDKREQRRRDQALGLVPFAVKLSQQTVGELQALARSRGVPLNELVEDLLRQAMASGDDQGAAA